MVDPIATKSEVASVEARVKLLESQAQTWISKNWPHFVTWLGVIVSLIRHL